MLISMDSVSPVRADEKLTTFLELEAAIQTVSHSQEID
jgi:hypothetical protein